MHIKQYSISFNLKNIWKNNRNRKYFDSDIVARFCVTVIQSLLWSYYNNSKQPALVTSLAANYFQHRCPGMKMHPWFSSGRCPGNPHSSVKCPKSLMLIVCNEWTKITGVNQTVGYDFCGHAKQNSVSLACLTTVHYWTHGNCISPGNNEHQCSISVISVPIYSY